MEYTPNLQLAKPASDDAITPEDFEDFFSGNQDTIDDNITRLHNRAAAIEDAITNVPVINTHTIVISATDWQSVSDHGAYRFMADVQDSNATQDSIFLRLAVNAEHEETAQSCGLRDICDLDDGLIRLYAKSRPTEELGGVCYFLRGGSRNSAIFSATNTSGFLSKTIPAGSSCPISFTWSSMQDANQTGTGTIRITANGTTRAVFRNVPQGRVTRDLSSYLASGETVVRVTISDIYENSQTFIFTITTVSLSISSTFQTNEPFSGAFSFPYTTVGDVDKTVRILLDGALLGIASVPASASRQQTYTIPARTHGAHTLEAYFTCNIEGQELESNHLRYEFASFSGTNTAPVIVCSYSGGSASQYTMLNVPFYVFTPNSLTTPTVTITVNGITQATLSEVNRAEQHFSYRADTVGTAVISMTAGNVTKRISVTVTESEVTARAETEHLALYLSAVGRSNAEENPAVWTYTPNGGETIAAQFRNFNFVSDGWQTDSDGIPVLRITGDARLTIPYKIFATDFKDLGGGLGGKTIILDFAVHDVRDYSAVILSCLSGGRGLSVTPRRASLTAAQSALEAPYKEDDHCSIAFVVEKIHDQRIIYTYVDGVISGTVRYPEEAENFQQTVPVDITVGSSDCTVDLYSIRIYDTNLSWQQMTHTWIADTWDVEEMLTRYHRNNVLDERGEVNISLLPDSLPRMTIICPELPQFKGDKKDVDVIFTDPANATRNWSTTTAVLTLSGVSYVAAKANVQGTSSQGYPRKNYTITFQDPITHSGNVIHAITLADHTQADTWALRDGAIQDNEFCLKADYASSEGANNVEIVRWCNANTPYQTPAQGANSAYRQGIDGFPIVLFWQQTNTAGDSVGNPTFIGKYNLNNNKTATLFGFQPGDQCWEVKDSFTDRQLFKSGDFSTDWSSEFEALYPSKSKEISDFAQFCAWVASTDRETASNHTLTTSVTYDGVTYTQDTAEYRLAKFKAEAVNWVEMTSVVFFYVAMDVFLLVDNRAKNTFWTKYAAHDGRAGSKWFSIFYDMDTALGINNRGALTFDPWLEDTDHTGDSDDGNVYNGQYSVFWCNLRDAFWDDIATQYRALRSSGALSYDAVMTAFEDHQAAWGEIVFNADAYYKYIEPLTNGVNHLDMCLGSKKQQRRQWMSQRLDYLDSKYNAGNARDSFIFMRAYAKSDLTITPYAPIYVSASFGGDASTPIRQRCLTGSATIAFPNLGEGQNDTVVNIFSASELKSVGDLSGLNISDGNFAAAVKLQELIIGSPSRTNGLLTTLELGNNALLIKLDLRNCAALGTGNQKSVDLRACTSIEEVYLEGTKVAGVSLPNGGVLRVLHLPETITNLTIRNQPRLSAFSCPALDSTSGTSGITDLWLEHINPTVINPLTALQKIPAGSWVRIIGFETTATNADELRQFYALLDQMKGLDETGRHMSENGTAQISGTIHIDTLGESELVQFQTRYPNITIQATHITRTLYYYNFDGTQLLYTEAVKDGGNGIYTGTPTRTATAQYTFTFVGWSKRIDASSADSDARQAIVEDRNVYAAYTQTVRMYTVTWQNSDGTTLEIDRNVPYGTIPTYDGATPQNANGETMRRWLPAVSAVTADITYTATYIPTYTVRFYSGVTLLDTVSELEPGESAVYSGQTPAKTDVDDPEHYYFIGWSPTGTNIQADTECFAQFLYFDVEETITDSWAQILAAVNNGTYRNQYQVGDTKRLDLGDYGIVTMQIAAFDTDELANGSGYAAITWLATSVLKQGLPMNPISCYSGDGSMTNGYGSIGGWAACALRTTLGQLTAQIQDHALVNGLKAVRKYSAVWSVVPDGTSGPLVETFVDATLAYQEDVETTDRIWIPSVHEIFGQIENQPTETKGAQYTVYASNSRLLQQETLPNSEGERFNSLWLRSASPYGISGNNAPNCFSQIYKGEYYNYQAEISQGIVIGFCT